MTALERRERRDDPPSPPGGRGVSGATEATSMMERFGPWLGLIALCLALYLPGLATLPPLDRDESRFIQASRQMVETGDYIRIKFQNEARNKKPIGAYWAQAASAELFGGADAPVLAYRLPSVLGALAAVLFTFWGGQRLFDRRTAFVAASLLASSIMLIAEAHQAKTDALLLASAVAAQASLAQIYFRRGLDECAIRVRALVFWAAIGVAILIKGPIVPMVSALTILTLGALDRSLSWLRDLKAQYGIPLALILVLPWFIAINQATDGAFLQQSVGGDLLPKLIGGQESHGAPPGYYLLLVSVTFFPGSLFLFPALRRAWLRRLLTAERFCLAWVAASWLVFELIPTKLPHYVLPLYPALALLVARFIIGADSDRVVLRRTGIMIGAAVWAVVAVAFGTGAIALDGVLDSQWFNPGLLPALAIITAAVATIVALWRGGALRAIGYAVAGTTVFSGMLLQTVLPGVDQLWLSRGASEMVRGFAGPGTMVASAGYSEPSLVVLLGTQTRLGPPEAAADTLLRNPNALALVAAPDIEAFQAALAREGVAALALDRRRGFNYSRGKWTELVLYRKAPHG